MSTPFCTLCGSTEPADLGPTIGICLDAKACHRRQDRNREHRQYVAEEIARAIEESVPRPAYECKCPVPLCGECMRYGQAQADAALARKIGLNETPVTPSPVDPE